MRGRTAAAVLLALAATALHLVLLAPFVQARRLLEPAPFVYGDYSIHLADGLQVREFLRARGAFWGWSPWFFAGYPAGIFDAPSNRPTGLVLWLAGDANPAVVFKLYVTAVLAAVPLLAGLAALAAGETALGAASALLLAALYFHQDRVVFVFCRYGMFHFLLASALTLLAAAVHGRLLDRPGGPRLLASAALLALALFAHPSAPVLLAPALAVAHFARRHDRRATLLGAGALLLAGLASAPWAAPLARNFAWAGSDSGFWSSGEVSLARDVVLATDHVGRNLLLLLAGAGLVLGGRRHLALAASSAVFLAVRHLGSLVPVIDRLEPARFTIPAGLFAVLPALEGLRALRGRPRAALGCALAAALLVGAPLALDPDFRPVPNFLLWTQPLEEREEARELVEALARHTDRSGRIALEQDWAGSRLHGFIASYLRLHLEREQLGGPHPFVKVRSNHLNFFDGSLAGRPIASWSDAELGQLLARYNVGWLVARRPATVRAARARPPAILAPVAEGKGFVLFQVAGPRSFLLSGSGETSADYDRIEVRGASPGGVVLKYHWHPALEASPPLELRPHMVPGDPDGFIEVANGSTRDFDIVTARRAWRPGSASSRR